MLLIYPPDSLPKREFYQWLDCWRKTFGEIKAIVIPWPSQLLKQYAETRILPLFLSTDISPTRGTIRRAITFDLDIISRRELRRDGICTYDYETEALRLRIQPQTYDGYVSKYKFWE